MTEQACYVYLKSFEQRAWGCGGAVGGPATYVDGAHRTRAYKAQVVIMCNKSEVALEDLALSILNRSSDSRGSA